MVAATTANTTPRAMAVRLGASQAAISPPRRGSSRNTGSPSGYSAVQSDLTNITLRCRVMQVEDPLVAELTYREAIAARERVRGVRRAITLPLRLIAAADLAGAI